MRMLRSILLEKKTQEQNAQISEVRKNMVGSGDRSKRRFAPTISRRDAFHRSPHRVSRCARLDTFLDGDIEDMLDNLVA